MRSSGPMRIAALFAAVVVLGFVIGVGLKQATSDDGVVDGGSTAIKVSPEEVAAKLDGSPPALAALHAQADALLPGGQRALDARLRELRGHPVVVNVWASWCGPCNEEAPSFQRVSLDRGREVGFLGVNLKDSRSGARRFLERYPAAYPSYEDPDGDIYNGYRLAGAPATIFYTPAGEKAYTRQGPYRSAADLERDIDRYALGREGSEGG